MKRPRCDAVVGMEEWGIFFRPLGERSRFPSKNEDLPMIAVGQDVDPLTRIAECLEKIIDRIAPHADSDISEGGDRIYSTREAAEELRLDEWTVRKYCRNKVFGTRLANGRWVIRQSEIDHYLKGQRIVHGRGVA